MTESEFLDRVRVVVEKCLPLEVDAFELAAPEMIHALFSGRSIKKSTAGGDSEFININDVKTVLEFIPLLHGCYLLLSRGARALKGMPKPSAEELLRLMADARVPPHLARVAVQECEEALRTLTI